MTTLRHGKARRKDRSKVYSVWASMLRRCDNPSQDSYPLYGGRGIKVCERWKKFDNFYADMGDPPPGYWLDRRDGDGDYEPGNCRWATPKEQRANQKPFVFTIARQEHLSQARKTRWSKSGERANHGFAKLTIDEKSAMAKRAALARWSAKNSNQSAI